MPTFFIDGSFYATQEYSYQAEVEADTLEQAIEAHKEFLATSRWPDHQAEKVDEEFNIEGKFSVYPSNESRADMDFDEVLAEDEEFKGAR